MLLIGQGHFVEGVAEQGPAVCQILPFGHHFGPFDQLAQVAGGNLGIFGGEIDKHGPLLVNNHTTRGDRGKSLKRAGEMFAVAAEGRGAEAELSGQGAVGRGGQQTLVNLPAFGVVADGTAFDHTCAPKQEFPQDAGWVSGYQGRRWRASTVSTNDGGKGEKGGKKY